MSSITGNWFAALPAELPEGALASLKKNAPPDLRWIHPGDHHLTLAFFGRENPARLPAVREVLAQVPFSGREVTLGSLLALPKPHRCSALSFELVEGRDELSALIAAWRGPLLEAAGCAPDDRPPLPHLTVARPPRGHTRAARETLLKWAGQLSPPAAPVRILPPVLYGRSHEQPGRRFRVLD